MSDTAAKILVVEDEQIVAVDIESHLERLGYRVVGTAVSGDEACRKVSDLEPDLVIMDVRIEGATDGIEAARRIRQSRDVPVVFLTAYADAETVERAKGAEPYGYLVKPFDPRDLHMTIQMALHKADVDRRLQESHDNLKTILNAQRHGTIMLDREGRVCFASQAALAMTGTAGRDAAGAALEELLPLPRAQRATLQKVCRLPQEDRHKVSVVLDGDTPRPRHLEIEIVDDPRNRDGKLLFLYDISPLFHLRRQLDEQAAFQNILGKSKAMRQVFRVIQEVARVDSTVLIEGQTGTGKELVARAIHQLGQRRAGPFVAINCAGLSEELAASQLFGHRRGSFTGASSDQQGLFEAAHGGTLFLDEIGELPLRVQTTLLRVLEEDAVLPLGESKPRPVNVRVLAATHRDLVQEVAQQRFRQDLLYRIRVARVTLPPLRDRREDIPLFVRAFLADHRAATGKQVDAVSDATLAILMEYDWPGNVRELRNALEFAVIRAQDSVLQVEDLPPELWGPGMDGGQDDAGLDELDQVRAALKRARGNRTRAAALLGMSRATLYRRLRELGIAEK
jgi:DNA-binding NtrC family response regulator